MDALRLHVARLAVAVLLVACGGGHSNDPTSAPSPASASEDERGSVGLPPTAPEYCTRLGFTLVDSQCKFLDGTSCEEWAFYRGECGKPHSYCDQHGGTVSTKTENMGTFTTVYAVCDLNGKQCKEGSFMQTGKCE